MYCAKCGKEIREGSKFCGFCGAPVAAAVKKTEAAPEAVLPEKTEKTVVEAPRVERKAPEKKEKKTGMVFVYGAVGLIAGVLAGVFLIKGMKKEPDPANSPVMVQETQMEESAEETESATEEAVTEETEVKETEFTAEETEESPDVPEPEMEAENSGEYILPECTVRLYTVEELRNFSLEELRLARNEIYARHGRIFKAEDLEQYFSGKSWYEPLYSAEEMDALGDSILNAFEVENRNRIVQVEGELK